MNQELFNSFVLMLALAKLIGESDSQVLEMLEKTVHFYLESYDEDDFLPEAEDCAARTLDWLQNQSLTNEDQTLPWLAALCDAVEKYKPNGERKPRRLFNGRWFRSARQPVTNRASQYFKDLGLYFLSIQLGKIPN